MAAVMTEILEPEGLGHDLLTEWAPWVRDDNEGRASWAVKPRIQAGYHGDMPRRLQLVDKIVARHRLENRQHWRVVARFYLGGRAIWEIARELDWSDDRVATTLIVFCSLVEREFRDSTAA